MKRDRVIETICGIQSEDDTTDFNKMQKKLRDRGFLDTDSIIKSGISKGSAVEIGPGPGYLGLEWLKKTDNTRLTGIEISNAMIKHAEKNSRDYSLQDRVKYIEANALSIPLPDSSSDSVFSSGSLHEWENPLTVIDNIYRILKPGGKLFISDLKRNLSSAVTIIFYLTVKGKNMKKGLISSIKASYTKDELKRIMSSSLFNSFEVRENIFGINITAQK